MDVWNGLNNPEPTFTFQSFKCKETVEVSVLQIQSDISEKKEKMLKNIWVILKTQ